MTKIEEAKRLLEAHERMKEDDMTQPRFAVWVPEATIRALVPGETRVQVLTESDGTRSLCREWGVGLEVRDGTRFFVLTLPPGEAPLWPEPMKDENKHSIDSLGQCVEHGGACKLFERATATPAAEPEGEPEGGDDLVEALQALSGRLSGTGRAERAAEAIREEIGRAVAAQAIDTRAR